MIAVALLAAIGVLAFTKREAFSTYWRIIVASAYWLGALGVITYYIRVVAEPIDIPWDVFDISVLDVLAYFRPGPDVLLPFAASAVVSFAIVHAASSPRAIPGRRVAVVAAGATVGYGWYRVVVLAKEALPFPLYATAVILSVECAFLTGLFLQFASMELRGVDEEPKAWLVAPAVGVACAGTAYGAYARPRRNLVSKTSHGISTSRPRRRRDLHQREASTE